MSYKTEANRKIFYNSKDWKEMREKALERDNYECQHCKEGGFVTVDSVREEGKRKKVILNVDHKYGLEHYPKLALHLDNLQTLCVYHHNVKEGRVFKGNTKTKVEWDDEKW